MDSPRGLQKVSATSYGKVSARQSVVRETVDVPPVRTAPTRSPKNGGRRENYQACEATDVSGLLRSNDKYPRLVWVLVPIVERCIAEPRWRSLPHANLRARGSGAYPRPGV